MAFNPPTSFALLLPLLIIVGGLILWYSWRAGEGMPTRTRFAGLASRTLAVAVVAFFLLNPGRWQSVSDSIGVPYFLLLDASQSMQVDDAANDTSRWQAALAEADKAKAAAEAAGFEVEWLTFDTQSRKSSREEIHNLSPEGDGTDLDNALESALNIILAHSAEPGGMIVFSDGRQAGPRAPENPQWAVRAGAYRMPIHTLLLGGEQEIRDLSIEATRRLVTTFHDQELQLAATIESHGLPPQITSVTLLDAQGSTIDSQNIEIPADSSATVQFSLTAPEESTHFILALDTPPEDQIATNNTTRIDVRVLQSQTRIFIAEGAPYWDSKFLAQLLRLQPHFAVRSVYRITDDRYFRIHSGESLPTDSQGNVFPSTREELAAYDVIIFGKGAEHFITIENAPLLREFVRDQGGAILFSRGKPYAGSLPALEALEPVEWGSAGGGEFSFVPSMEGTTAGLFGQALPPADSPVWATLPPIHDGRGIANIKAFSRVLAHGQSTTTQARFPAIVTRRFGQGVTTLVNADGLWRWDFFPDARETGNMYETFWNQLIQWMVSYSEFLPGHDFALQASPTILHPNDTTGLRVSWRGQGTTPSPRLRITPPGQSQTRTIDPARDDQGEMISWRSTLQVDAPGVWTIELDGTDHPPLTTNLTVLAPPAEGDNLSADPDNLERIATLGRGSFFHDPPDWNSIFDNANEQLHQSAMIWNPLWARWWALPALALCFSIDWWTRRRNGLV